MDKYIIRETNSDLDDLEVAVGAPCEFHYADPRSINFRNKIVLRPVFSLSEEDDSQLKGVWIEDKFLRADPESITETTVPGKHLRTFVVFVVGYEITLVEYEDRLQLSVIDKDRDYVLYTEYRDLKHFGSIKLLMDECQTSEEVADFIREVKEYD